MLILWKGMGCSIVGMGQYRTAKMLMLVLCETVDNWLLSAAVHCACSSQLLLSSNVLCVSILE